MKPKTFFLIPLLSITASMLFVSVFFKLPYGYYTLLRVIVFIASGLIAIAAYKLHRYYWMAILILITLLFNPIIKVHFVRGTWRGIDLLAGVVFLIFIFNLKKKKNDK